MLPGVEQLAPDQAIALAGGLVLVLLAATLEGIVRTWWLRQSYDWGAYGASLADVALRRLLSMLGYPLLLPVLAWAHRHRVADLEMDSAQALALLFLGQEFFYYWFHRCGHHVRWFWATHAVHHSPEQFTWANALRLGATGGLAGNGLFFVPLVWLGFPPLLVFASVALNLAYQFWLHATWVPKLGPLEWVFNTPSHHRAHHGCNSRYLDCNFGGVLIIFDRLFGTFVAESPLDPPRYGLVHPVGSRNPLVIAFHEWRRMARDLRAARGWAEGLRVLFGRPR